MRELEYKFTVHPSFVVPRFEGDAGVHVVTELPEQELRSTYLDTADLRLARSGMTLRHRTGETDEPIWTLKLPSTQRDVLVREEIDLHAEGSDQTPPDDAIDLTTASHRGA